MKHVVSLAVVLIALLGSQADCCDRVVSHAAVVVADPAVALAVPLVFQDAGHHASATVLAAPLVSPLVVVPQPLAVPHVRVQAFGFRRGVRAFAR